MPQVVLESQQQVWEQQTSVLTVSLHTFSAELVLCCALLSGICRPALYSTTIQEVIHFLFLF